jgi:redox-sensitive bicupin YhaK (pirin superfamily)
VRIPISTSSTWAILERHRARITIEPGIITTTMNRRAFGRIIGSSLAGLAGASCEPPRPSVRGRSPVGPAVTGRSLRTRDVTHVIAASRTLEGAGFPVRRPFPTQALALMDPFVLLDEVGPIDWPPGGARGAPDHPHRGFETVTYVLDGGVQHRDSRGGRGLLGPGDVQWMTAGAGIVHSEMPPDAMLADGGPMHGFQLWVNLPAREKWIAPRYQDVGHAEMPIGGTDDARARARVIAGEALGVRSRVETRTPIVVQHWTLEPGGRVEQRVRGDHDACVLVFRGACMMGASARVVREGELAIFGAGDTIAMGATVDAPSSSELLLLAGVPIREPVARRGPFVMNTDEEIQQAFDDYRAGRMGSIAPG